MIQTEQQFINSIPMKTLTRIFSKIDELLINSDTLHKKDLLKIIENESINLMALYTILKKEYLNIKFERNE